MGKIKIGIVIPEKSGTFQKDVEQIANELNIVPVFCAGHFAKAVPIVRKLLHENPDIQALVSRSTTAIYLRREFDLPVVDMELGNFAFAKAITELPDKSGKFIVVQFSPSASVFDVESIAKVCNIDLTTIFLDTDRVGDVAAEVKAAGRDRVVSSVAVVTDPCREAGLDVIPLHFSRQTIEKVLRQALEMVKSKQNEIRRTDQLFQILNTFTEGFLAVDRPGRIIMFNKALCDILKMATPPTGARLEELKESIPFIRVIVTAQENAILEYQGNKYIVTRPTFFGSRQTFRLWSVSSVSSIQEKASAYQRNLQENGYRARYRFADIVSICPEMAQLKLKAKRYARANGNIMILGESGTGKEMMAQSIHNESDYRDGPFVAINCAALPETLLESELFGYEEGAFTGARRRGKEGLIELSNHGTLFLDEIGLMPIQLQAKLLRSLQERQISRLGGTRLISVENRIICATNSDLVKEVAEGRFRDDLFYRLDVLSIRIPPLRERVGDIPFLVRVLLHRKCAGMARTLEIDDTQMHYFTSYSWPGNFRQLEAFLDRLLALNTGPVVEESLLRSLFEELPTGILPEEESGPGWENRAGAALPEGYQVSGTLAEIERQIIMEAYYRYGGNLTLMTQKLGIGRTTLWRKLKDLGLRNVT